MREKTASLRIFTAFIICSMWLGSIIQSALAATPTEKPADFTVKCPEQPDLDDLAKLIKAGAPIALVFRHAEAEETGKKCKKDRNCKLTDDGAKKAQHIAETIKTMSLPIGSVASSYYVRAYDTARLLSPKKTRVEPLEELDIGKPVEGLDKKLQELLAKADQTKNVVIVVTHEAGLKALSGKSVQKSDALALRLQGTKLVCMGELTTDDAKKRDDWASLRDKLKPSR